METTATVKKQLERYQEIKERINNNLEEVERLRNCMVRVKVAFKDAPGWERKQSDQNVILTEINKLAEHIKSDVDKMSGEFYAVERLIDWLGNKNERDVLRYKYIYDYSWAEIEEKLSYSRSSLKRIHHTALYKIACMLNRKVEPH